MKKLFIIIAVLLICSGVFAQNITWEMAVLKYAGSETEDFSPQRPIDMKNGDEFQIYIKSDSPGYCYVVQENADRTSSFIFGGPLAVGRELYLPGNNDDFTVPSGKGTVRFHVVVSSSQKSALEQYQKQSSNFQGAQHIALMEEIVSVRSSISTVAEPPEKPVRMGAGTRGKPLSAYQYEGQNTYVRAVTIRH